MTTLLLDIVNGIVNPDPPKWLWPFGSTDEQDLTSVPSRPQTAKMRWAKVMASIRAASIMTRSAQLTAEKAAEEAVLAEGKRGQALLELERAKQRAAEQGTGNKSLALSVPTAAYLTAAATAKALAAVSTQAASTAALMVTRMSNAISMSALRANQNVALSFVDSYMRSLSPSLRLAMGEWLFGVHQSGGLEVNDIVVLRVLRPVFEELKRSGLASDGTSPANVFPVLSIRVHRPDSSPPLEDLYEGDNLGLLLHEFKPPIAVLPDSSPGLADEENRPDERAETSRDPAAQGSGKQHPADEEWPKGYGWPKEWDSAEDRVHVLEVDFDLHVAVRSNWEHEPWYVSVDSRCSWLPQTLLRLAIKGFMLGARARVWWHVEKRQLKLALHCSSRVTHFRSYAELGLLGCCGCASNGSVPDYAGVVSRLIRLYLNRITPQHPLEIDLPKKGSPNEEAAGEVRWTSSVTGKSYTLPLH